MEPTLDLSVMLIIHAALRRDLEQLARVAGKPVQRDRTRLSVALGWEQFKKFLVIHHRAEDDLLWPVLRAKVTEHPDQVALVDLLEAEHADIEPLLDAVDASAARNGGDKFVDVVDELGTRLTKHLNHEETDGLTLVAASLDLEEWQRFGHLHGERLLGYAETYVPWLLDSADQEAVNAFLTKIPPPLAVAYRDQWAPAYANLRRWDNSEITPTGAEDN